MKASVKNSGNLSRQLCSTKISNSAITFGSVQLLILAVKKPQVASDDCCNLDCNVSLGRLSETFQCYNGLEMFVWSSEWREEISNGSLCVLENLNEHLSSHTHSVRLWLKTVENIKSPVLEFVYVLDIGCGPCSPQVPVRWVVAKEISRQAAAKNIDLACCPRMGCITII